jgi:hypothetical protein
MDTLHVGNKFFYMFFMVLFHILSSFKKLMGKGLLRAVLVELLSPECFAEVPQHI